ncbi:secreted RxLR effector protein 161-like [Solanum dulcamara]|uniref:secreted RxLR effector protein 161-like n=1 Tax=Solanum dulcamara TaxID=45834 RepID=UPI0024864C9F|nr:secreted RxLR effector protein 161-like [Solanum dulcamara]
MTRPDLAFSVQKLSQYMHCPKESHMDATLRVARYIKEALGLGLFMSSEVTKQLLAYCNSDWGAYLETRRSVTGYLIKFGGALISWKSKKQETVSRSSAKAEFRSMANCAAEVTWLIGLFRDLGFQVDLPVRMVCDSESAIQIAVNPIFHERTKHIDIDCHFVREKICQGTLETEFTHTKD